MSDSIQAQIGEVLGEVRRALEEVEGYKELAPWQAFLQGVEPKLFALNFELTVAAASEFVPERTSWYLVVTDHYPFGAAFIAPAKTDGIECTFAHQTLNEPGELMFPWRSGEICVTTPASIAGQLFQSHEPTTAVERARWQIQRALLWLESAAAGKLQGKGHRFELPHLGSLSGPTVLFRENDVSFHEWDGEALAGQGFIDFHSLHEGLAVYTVKRLALLKQGDFRRTDWRGFIGGGKPTKAIWLIVPEMPTNRYWRHPATWGELEATLAKAGVNLWQYLNPLLHCCRIHDPKERQKPNRTLLLLGFPIPYHYEEPNARIHWLAISLPLLSGGKETANGFRTDEKGYLRRDHQRVFTPETRLQWLTTENWDTADIHSRGALPMEVSSLHVALIGAGAVGSHLAEALVRGGLRQITVLDRESLEIGNLTRHTLGLDSIGRNKAEALAGRLQTLSPDVSVKFLPKNFAPKRQHLIETCQLIIDCTGNREVLRGLTAARWEENTWFASLAIGYAAKRTYLYTVCGSNFPVDDLFDKLQPWMDLEKAQRPEDLMYPAVGCYHPAFPASELDIQLATSIMGKQLIQVIKNGERQPRLWVNSVEQAENGAVSVKDGQLEQAHELGN